MEHIYTKERLLYVKFSNHFSQSNSQLNTELQDSSQIIFYQRNMSELGHFDSNRVLAAVDRLAAAEPRYIDDYSKALITVMERFPTPEITSSTANCLQKWLGDKVQTSVGDLERVARFEERGEDSQNWPQNLVILLLQAKSKKMETVVVKLWSQNQLEWEETILNSGINFNSQLTTFIDRNNRSKNLSIINLIGRSKGINSANLLDEIHLQLGSEYTVAIEKAKSH